MEFANMLYNYERQKGLHLEEIMTKLKADNMAPLYEHLCAKFAWQINDDLLQTMK